MPNFEITALRPFVPATDLDESLAFYTDLGFTCTSLGSGIANVQLDNFSFLLQHFSAPGYENNYMMHMLVRDLDAWWTRIAVLDLAARYNVRPPTAPARQPWGLVISYVVAPSGVLWHIAQDRNA